MGGFLSSLLEGWQRHLEQQHNRPFLEGCMAACAMVASTDGMVDFAERVRVDQVLETLDRLKVFDPHVGVDLFNDYIEAILANPEEGHNRALNDMRAAADTPEAAELLVRVCCAVSEAGAGEDGVMPLVDQIEIVTLCAYLGLDPRRFGLYREGTLPT
ncbi:tellurite resistance TerB family protein [Roseospirillum parvum]|uniref:Tellurite resistance protein TerB n=1 Tax=Roseospirillum parvum TaxID=83401 RepID=A0A1G8DNP9_9PROT|nr:TerB family tellurite resistance protein [Roseospirillum parvum]SDH59225.1 tellurite resistance protein TerB [Roseospirillum parvum]